MAKKLRTKKINILVLYEFHKEFEWYIVDTNVKRTMFLWRLISQFYWEYLVYITVWISYKGSSNSEVIGLHEQLIHLIWFLNK